MFTSKNRHLSISATQEEVVNSCYAFGADKLVNTVAFANRGAALCFKHPS